jgi:hypothetical protein
MKRIVLSFTLGLIVAPLAACSGSDQTPAPAANIEEMGPEGGSNVTTTPPANAAIAPVGSTGDGNIAPGNANPENPRPGATPPAGQ